MKLAGICVFLAFVAVIVQVAESCTCLRRHPQLIYNTEDYVLVVEVTRKLTGTSSHAEYSVIVREVLKNKAPIYVGTTIVLSALKICSPTLVVNKRYVVSGTITGGKFVLSACGFAIPIEQFTATRRELFRAYGTQGKTCEVPAAGPGTTPSNKQCKIDSNSKIADCQYQLGVCVPDRGKCVWRRSTAYTTCISRP